MGLMTGDVSVNPNAPIMVMTTEILRSMLYRSASHHIRAFQRPPSAPSWEAQCQSCYLIMGPPSVCAH